MRILSLAGKNKRGKSHGPEFPFIDPRCFFLLIFFAPFFFAGCAMQQHPVEKEKEVFHVLPDKFQKKALDYESRGQLLEAMQNWWIVSSFHPDDDSIKERINSLRKKCQSRARDHFQEGVRFYQNGLISDARREFLLTLTYDQDHDQALDYLENKLHQPVFKTHVVQHGDTVRDIAEKEFHDPNKKFLITAFNDVDPERELIPGTPLQIPLLGDNFPGKGNFAQVMQDKDAMVLEPRRQKRKVSATVPGEKIAEAMAMPAQEKMSDGLHDVENYQKAKEYLEQEEYRKSLQMLLRVDINYRDVRQLIASTEVFLQQEADAHYRKGISYFLAEDLDKAIMEWEEVLRLSPNHLKARKDLQNARKLKQKVERY
ncbi:MAG: hypothetical protein KQH63_07790 [Desulfobulbaceae bacterium]|nr:hypothetical protein [Desulfobulbaceae bacterium]